MKQHQIAFALALLATTQAQAGTLTAIGANIERYDSSAVQGRDVAISAVDRGSIQINPGSLSVTNYLGSFSGLTLVAQPAIPVLELQPIPTTQPVASLNDPSHSASVSGSFYYSVSSGGDNKSGNFSENESNSDGALLNLEFGRYGYGYDAQAYAENGATHARATTAYDTTNGYGNSSASASASSSDWFVITGGTGWSTASLEANLAGTLAGGGTGYASVSFSVNYTPDTSSCYYGYCYGNPSQYYQTVISENQSINGRRARASEEYFIGEFDFTYDQPFKLTTTLSVSAQNGGTADFLEPGSSASLIGLVLPEGALLTSASGLFVAANVPEPETYALMLAGLGLVGFMARRRGRG